MTLKPTATELLKEIYGTVPPVLADGIAELISTASASDSKAGQSQLWTERDVVLITYADQIRQDEMTPLATLRSFLLDHKLQHLIDCVHLLPFCPYTSDDGFSVIDYLAVDPLSGTWGDIAALGEKFTHYIILADRRARTDRAVGGAVLQDFLMHFFRKNCD